MVRNVVPAAGGRMRKIALGVIAGLLSAGLAQAQAAPPQAATPAPNQRLFPNDGGMVLNFIKPDKVADFEEVLVKLKEALQKSDKPERKEQAAGWKVFKSTQMAQGNAVYIMRIDPV